MKNQSRDRKGAVPGVKSRSFAALRMTSAGLEVRMIEWEDTWVFGGEEIKETE